MRPSADDLRLIGCSDLPVLLGLREPGPVGLWNRVRYGIETPVDREVHDAGELGRRLERGIAEHAASLLGYDPGQLEKPPTIRHPGGRRWERYSLDLVISRPPIGQAPLVLEVKAPLPFRLEERGWGEPGTDEVPLSVFSQVQGQLDAIEVDRDRWTGTELPDVDVVHVACLRWGRVAIYPVARDRRTGERLAVAGEKFWIDHVEGSRPPPMDGMSGAAHYLEEVAKLRAPMRKAKRREIEAALEFIDLDERCKRLEKERNAVRQELLEYLGPALGSEGGGLKIVAPERRGRVRYAEVAEALAQRLGLTKIEYTQIVDAHRDDPYRVLEVKNM